MASKTKKAKEHDDTAIEKDPASAQILEEIGYAAAKKQSDIDSNILNRNALRRGGGKLPPSKNRSKSTQKYVDQISGRGRHSKPSDFDMPQSDHEDTANIVQAGPSTAHKRPAQKTVDDDAGEDHVEVRVLKRKRGRPSKSDTAPAGAPLEQLNPGADRKRTKKSAAVDRAAKARAARSGETRKPLQALSEERDVSGSLQEDTSPPEISENGQQIGEGEPQDDADGLAQNTENQVVPEEESQEIDNDPEEGSRENDDDQQENSQEIEHDHEENGAEDTANDGIEEDGLINGTNDQDESSVPPTMQSTGSAAVQAWQRYLDSAFDGIAKVGQWNRDGETGSNVPPLQVITAKRLKTVCQKFIHDIQSSDTPFVLLEDLDNPSISERQRLSLRTWSKISKLARNVKHDTLKTTQDLHAHVIPDLTRVLQAVVISYKDTNMDSLHLGTLKAITTLIQTLGQRAEDLRENHKINPTLVIVKPVTDSILVPIRKAHKSLSTALFIIQSREENIRTLASMATQRIEAQAATAHKAAHSQRIKDWIKHWQDLHTLRLNAETRGGSHTMTKIHLLRSMDLQTAARVPAITDWEDWDQEADAAILGTLESHTGPDVYRHVIWRHCQEERFEDEVDVPTDWVDQTGQIHATMQRRRVRRVVTGPLRRFSVLQIVSRALFLREKMLERDEREGRQSEEWVVAIFDPRAEPTA